MLINDHLANSGTHLFRWRSFVLTIFIPIIFLATLRGERIELQFGDLAGDLYSGFCIALILAGIVVRVMTVGYVPARTSGRNTKGQVADQLNTTGFYSVVRNPLYLGNALGYLGAALLPQTPWIGLAMLMTLILYFERIIAAEERFLVGKFGKTYTDWAAQTPAMLPAFRQWRAPKLPFSWRTVIRREHPTWLGTFTLLYLLKLVTDYVEGDPMADLVGWHIAMCAALTAQITIMVLKKKTRVFKVEGR